MKPPKGKLIFAINMFPFGCGYDFVTAAPSATFLENHCWSSIHNLATVYTVYGKRHKVFTLKSLMVCCMFSNLV